MGAAGAGVRAIVDAMSNQLQTIALVVSVVYGLTIGLLAVLRVEPLGTIAAIGGIVVAAVWAIAVLMRDRSGDKA